MKKLIFTTLLLLGGLTLSFSQIVITEIFYNQPGPGTDNLEYIELYNNGTADIDMTGYSMEGVTFTFPPLTLGAGQYVLLSEDSVMVQDLFGQVAYQWTGALGNSGETLSVLDSTGAVQDSVDYSDDAPWPFLADGYGYSLVLCDVNADNNDPANWLPAVSATGVIIEGQEIYANPGSGATCPSGPMVTFLDAETSISEGIGTVTISLAIDNESASATTVDVMANLGMSTADGADFSMSGNTVTFEGGTDTLQTFSFEITDDMDNEGDESLLLELANVSNGGVVTGGSHTVNIIDNDVPLTNALILTGLYDGPLPGGVPKGIEIYVAADIADLSAFGVGVAINGGGSSGEDFSFPAVSATAGDYIYVTSDSTGFRDFFGVDADYISGALNINGDDAVELFESGLVIDTFGDINMDGTGTPWEYLDGWAYRVSGTGPDGITFVLDNWMFSGPNALDGESTNATAATPFPIGTYSMVAPTEVDANDDMAEADQGVAITINVLINDVMPSGITTLEIVDQPANGTAVANELVNVSYTSADDFCGGVDVFTYRICDAVSCDTASVSVTVICPPSYPRYDIAVVTTVDADGIPDSTGVSCELAGIVHGIDLQGNDNIQFVLIDGTGGITCFSADNFGYTVAEGDALVVQGTITEFSGLTQISLDNLTVESSGNPLVTPAVVTVLDESTESELVTIQNVSIVNADDWAGDGSSFNVEIQDGSGNSFNMRIDSDVELSGMPIPNSPFNVTGLGGQFDNSVPKDEGYQILPRYAADIEEIVSVIDPTLGEAITFYPNPVRDVLKVESSVALDAVRIHDMMGRQIMEIGVEDTHFNIQTRELLSGFYILTFVSEDRIWSVELVKI